ncbi:hypothetical protein [Escherichia coli]|nr:hypothetical protein [Escherichia coli]
MPVRLNTIPDAESYPAPPARIKWLSALLLMLLRITVKEIGE